MVEIETRSPASTRTEEAHRVIRQNIIEGRFRPNTHLVAGDLASQLGASRTPVREALQLLENEGLVIKTGRGFIVREHTVEEIRHIYEVRAGLEELGARLAAERATAEQIQAIEAVGCHRRDTVEHWQDLIVDLNSSFHDAVMEASSNPLLHEVNQRISEHFFNYRIAKLYSREEAAAAIDGHAEILQRIQDRDIDGAGVAARRHVLDALDILLSKLR